MAEKWRWFDQPRHGDPDNARHRLAIDDGSSFGGRTILECGNLDSEYQDRIAATPDLIESLEYLLAFVDGDKGIINPYRPIVKARDALAKARGKEVPS